MVEITPTEARAWIDGNSRVRIIDCREPDEFQICRIPGAELIKLSTWGFEAGEKLADKDQPILVYCHHGMRSQTAADYLVRRGYTNVRSLKGGVDLWAREVDPAMARY